MSPTPLPTDLPTNIISWTDQVGAFAAVGSAIVSLFGLVFIGLQVRKQTQSINIQRQATEDSQRLLSAQIAQQIEQTKQMTKAANTECNAAELNFNLSVMARLQDVLWQVSDHETTREKIWGNPPSGEDLPDYKRPILGTWAILDVLSMALAACDRLPNFSRNDEDWIQYTLDSLHQSPALLKEALEVGATYWPEVYPLAKDYADNGRCSAGEYIASHPRTSSDN